jgi:hypothetical protein
MEKDQEDDKQFHQSNRQSVADLAKRFQLNLLKPPSPNLVIENRARSKSDTQTNRFTTKKVQNDGLRNSVYTARSTPKIPTKPHSLRSYPSSSSIKSQKELVLSSPNILITQIASDSNTNASVSSQDGQAITKRERIIDEIYQTEKTFLSDMHGEH